MRALDRTAIVLRKARIYIMALSGVSIEVIGKVYGLKPRYVHRILAERPRK